MRCSRHRRRYRDEPLTLSAETRERLLAAGRAVLATKVRPSAPSESTCHLWPRDGEREGNWKVSVPTGRPELDPLVTELHALLGEP